MERFLTFFGWRKTNVEEDNDLFEEEKQKLMSEIAKKQDMINELTTKNSQLTAETIILEAISGNKPKADADDEKMDTATCLKKFNQLQKQYRKTVKQLKTADTEIGLLKTLLAMK